MVCHGIQMTSLPLFLALAIEISVGASSEDPICTFESCPQCLSDSEVVQTGKNLSLRVGFDGSLSLSLPFRIGRCLDTWDSQALVATIVGILAWEKLGINIEYVHAYDYEDDF